MLATEVRRSTHVTIQIYSIIHIFLYMVILGLLIILNDYGYLSDYVFAGLGILFLFNLVIHINARKSKIYQHEYRITSLQYPVDLPSSFIKKGRLIMIDGRKCYVINHQVIPAIFVEFVEGRRAYLIKELTEIQHPNLYKIIYIQQNRYAIVEDILRKRHLVHADNLEIVQ